MHAVVPRLATIHVHSINTMLGRYERMGRRIWRSACGTALEWIPYVGSGLPLAREVEKTFSNSPDTEILVLGNHGLVVCGEDARAAEELLYQVEKRIANEPGGHLSPTAPYATYNPRIGMVFARLEAVHALSTDAISRTILVEGILYPCQAIFLGPSTPLLAPSLPVSEAIERYECCNGARPRFFVVEGSGVIVNESMTRAELECSLDWRKSCDGSMWERHPLFESGRVD